MKLDYRFEPIAEFDQAGELVSAGGYWLEPRPKRHRIMMTGGHFFAAVSLFGLVWWPWFLMLLPMASLYFKGLFMSHREREFVFDADGPMRLSHGTRANAKARRITGHHDRVVSVEAARVEGYGWIVRVVTVEGDTIWLTEDLQEWQALKIAVHLSTALDDIRRSAAYRPAPGPMRLRMQGGSVELHIG